MNPSVDTLGPTQVKITIEVPFEELQPAIDAAYKKIGRQVKVQGFRPGKVPARILDQRVGRGAVLEEALNDALPGLYGKALEATDLKVVGRPEVDVQSFGDGEPLVFSATVDVRPEIELPAYDALPVVVDDAEVPDEQVDEQISGLQDRFATLAAVDRAVAPDDFVSLDLRATVDGELVEGTEAKGMSYQVGSEELLPGIDAALVGMTAGETRTFDSELHYGEYAGRTAQVEVTVASVKEKQVPDLDDDFAMTASEFDTLDELRADLRTRLERVQRLQQGLQARDRTLEALVAATEVPLPESLVAAEVEWRHHRVEEDVKNAGLELDAYLESQGQSHDDFHAELRTGAEQAVKSQLILDAIADKEEIGVSDADLSDQVVRQAQRSGVSPEVLAQQIMQAGQLGALVGDVRRGKALALVTQNAQITDASGRPVSLDALREQLGGGQPDEGDDDDEPGDEPADDTAR
ncbi:MAG TPA: trigger factor [Mycobacteriales bacterium]|nr:trigger factor [Mycobacteriales bacterium]